MEHRVSPGHSDHEEFEFLEESGRAGAALRPERFLHLDQPIGILNYIRMADEIAARIPRGRLLDWGCGFGQMTYLLRRRGFEVVAFDLGVEAGQLPDTPLTRSLGVVSSDHPTKLPFEDGAFDVVLGCGVLEHVDEYSEPGNEPLSLREIRRVLRDNGQFLIYQLPQRYTWAEAVTRTLGLGYSHPRRFTEKEIRRLLADTGFRVDSLCRNNMFPKNLTGLPGALRRFYSRFGAAIIRADRAISRVPLLNHIAGVMEIVARRV